MGPGIGRLLLLALNHSLVPISSSRVTSCVPEELPLLGDLKSEGPHSSAKW
jgi:hypothetical protein